METFNVRSWFRSCCLATLAAASVGVNSVGAQSATQEPEGMPVYRQKKSSFFQNPFSNGYQKLWNKAKGETASHPQYQTPNGEKYSTNAAYAMEEGQIVEVDGVPTTEHMTAKPTPTKKRWSSQVNQFSSKSVEPLSRSTLPSAQRPSTATRHKVSKPTLGQQLMQMGRQQPQAEYHPQPQMQQHHVPQQQMVPAQGADRVVHVKDVNDGTPALGTEVVVQPDADLIKTLAPGEEIKSVKERVIGVYRDGKLVPVNSAPITTSSVPMAMPPAKPVAAAQKEVDPWFGDTVNAPSAEVQELEGKEQTTEALPPQSSMTQTVVPEEGTIYVEQTGYAAAPAQPVTIATKTTYAAAPDGEVLPAQAMPQQAPMRRVAPGMKMKQVSPDVLRKYQTTYRR